MIPRNESDVSMYKSFICIKIFEFKNEYNFKSCIKILITIAKSLEFIHNNEITYNDLKLENIMLDKNNNPHYLNL